jgi:phosphatidylserine/phosphatidylglycerophosphate/cardiolipin synthase-like enzyme
MAFSFTDDAIGQALIDAQARGVTVSGVVERQSANGTGSEYPVLTDAGIDVLTDGNCYIMHHKTIVVDERIVVTGSYNFTKSAEQSNDENLLIIDSPAFAREYMAEYARVRQQAEQPTQCGS